MLEIVDPAIHHLIEASNSLRKWDRTGLLRNDLDFLFESFPAFLGDAQAILTFVTFLVTGHKSVS